jgi:hypothetical protein
MENGCVCFMDAELVLRQMVKLFVILIKQRHHAARILKPLKTIFVNFQSQIVQLRSIFFGAAWKSIYDLAGSIAKLVIKMDQNYGVTVQVKHLESASRQSSSATPGKTTSYSEGAPDCL